MVQEEESQEYGREKLCCCSELRKMIRNVIIAKFGMWDLKESHNSILQVIQPWVNNSTSLNLVYRIPFYKNEQDNTYRKTFMWVILFIYKIQLLKHINSFDLSKLWFLNSKLMWRTYYISRTVVLPQKLLMKKWLEGADGKIQQKRPVWETTLKIYPFG